jgi:hypothetical protein
MQELETCAQKGWRKKEPKVFPQSTLQYETIALQKNHISYSSNPIPDKNHSDGLEAIARSRWASDRRRFAS